MQWWLVECMCNAKIKCIGFAVAFINTPICEGMFRFMVLLFLYNLKVTRRDDSKLWIAYSNILGKSNTLKEKQGDDTDPELKPSIDPEGNDIPIPEDANKWVLKVCEEIINEYKEQFTLEELIFGPGMIYFIFGWEDGLKRSYYHI